VLRREARRRRRQVDLRARGTISVNRQRGKHEEHPLQGDGDDKRDRLPPPMLIRSSGGHCQLGCAWLRSVLGRGRGWQLGFVVAVSSLYRGHRYPVEIISRCVWLYHRFPLSYREIEEMMAERGVIVSYETIRKWCRKFGPMFAQGLRRRRPRPGDKWHLDEVFCTINGKRQYLWQAVDQDGKCPGHPGHVPA
jgi:hypothetical protein